MYFSAGSLLSGCAPISLVYNARDDSGKIDKDTVLDVHLNQYCFLDGDNKQLVCYCPVKNVWCFKE